MNSVMCSDHLIHSRQVKISNRLGLHARAAAKLVQVAQGYDAEMSIEKNGESVDAKSVLSLLTLECPFGTNVVIKAQGADASVALEAVDDLIRNKFGEE